MGRQQPPLTLEWLLARVVPGEMSEYLLGDLAEEYAARVVRTGRFQSNCWYLNQILQSLPPLALAQVRHWQRRFVMQFFNEREQRFAWVGLILYIPALILVSSGVTQSLGFPALADLFDPFISSLAHPVIVLGGLGFGFLLALLPILRINLQNQDGELISTVRLKLSWLNLAIVSLSVLIISIIFVYLLAENLGIFAAFR